MSSERLPSQDRMKKLLLAVRKIELQMEAGGGKKLSIAAVARAAGVTPALIHNSYPSIAALVRSKVQEPRRQPAASGTKESRQRNVELRREIASLKAKLAKIATLNEMLSIENRRLEATLTAENVVRLERVRRKKLTQT